MSSDELPKGIEDTALMRHVALLVLSGVESQREIAKRLKVDRSRVSRVIKAPEFQAILDQLSEHEIRPLINKAKDRLVKLAEKAISVVEDHLNEKNLDAAKLVLKSVGLAETEDKPGDTSITVIMPGAQEPKTIEAEYKEEG